MSTIVAPTARPGSHEGQLPSRESREREQFPNTSSPVSRSYSSLASGSAAKGLGHYHMASSSPARPSATGRASVEEIGSSQISPAHGYRGDAEMTNAPPLIKKERPSSPDHPSEPSPAPTRHRPRKLDLSANMSAEQAKKTSRPSAPLSAMQDVGLACLSPGFATHNPEMQQQVMRSMDVQKEQRRIIEARLNNKGKDLGNGPDSHERSWWASFCDLFKTVGNIATKRSPTGPLHYAPSAHHFASEPRVVQSAPLNQSFTGLKPGSAHVHPLSRQVLEHSHHSSHHGPSNHYQTQAGQSAQTPVTATRLPPIQDVFANENLGSPAHRPNDTLSRQNSHGSGNVPHALSNNAYPPHSAHAPMSAQHPGVSSPGFLPPHQVHHQHQQGQHYPAASSSSALHPPPRNPIPHEHREFKSADEAVQSLTGGREELLPKIVHYGGHQPPTPPSPLPPGHPGHQQHHSSHNANGAYASGASKMRSDSAVGARSVSGRRRNRDEYERDFGEAERMDVDPRAAGDDRGRRWEGEHGDGPAYGRSEAPQGHVLPREGYGRLPAPASGPHGVDETEYDRMRRKKARFMELVSEAWDLMHE